MATNIVPLFGLGNQSISSTITSQRRLNLFYEIQLDGDKTRAALIGTPGTTLFSDDLGDTPIRGWLAVGSLFYLVHRGTFYEVNNAGTITSRGTLNTVAGRVDMAYDGAVLVVVDGTNGYTYTVATTTFAEISDGQYPDTATTVTWMDGFFIVGGIPNSDQFQWSPDGSAWDSGDVATAESQPDGIVRVFTDHGELLLFGETTTEPWGNIGAADNPFAPIKGSIAQFGLAARWSLCQYNDGVAFLGKNLQGQVQVYYLKGYTPLPISNQQVDAIFNGYATVSDASAFAFMDRGHPMYQINFPTAMKSWRYDMSTQHWFEVAYGVDDERHRGEMQLDFINQTLLADYSNGSIYRLDPDVYTDNGAQISREVRARHIFNQADVMIISELYVDFETGVGLISGQGSDPQAMLQVSKDNGHTFGNERWETMGEIGEYRTRVHWRRLGVGYDFVFKIRVTDPVRVVMTFAALQARKGSSERRAA